MSQTNALSRNTPPSKARFGKRLYRYRYVYLLATPGILYYLVFKIAPMWGIVLAFQKYSPYAGVWNSPWVGLKFFKELVTARVFPLMVRNTLVINFISLAFFFPLPILLSVMLNEVRGEGFKRINQSIVYLPHFLSWVVVVSLTYFLLSTDVGVINKILFSMGREQITFLSNPKLFYWIVVTQSIWRDTGWGTIIFLAALSGVDPQLYEAAVMDGASRLRQIWHITLTSIRPTIVTLLIIRIGHMADVGFEQMLLMQNPLVMSVAEVFDTYAFNQGILRGQLSFGVAVGLFKNIIGLSLIFGANMIAKRSGHSGIY
ncbi:MAG: ABC transporter permease subunit [Oscillospiraceae bacterium]|jgi:putative aldouronate transport system permease protein|nr:ABC transporter permease subunit [Oscillospiraceae bacterium]